MVLKLPLDQFLSIIRELEYGGSDIWANTSEAVGNYLSGPLADSHLDMIEKILAGWKSRRRNIDWAQLKSIWTPEMQQFSFACDGLRLATCDPASEISLGDHRISVENVIGLMYGRPITVDGIGATNASKLLALSLPNLFVMWDELNIRGLQRVGSYPKHYCSFMVEMGQYADRLVRETAVAENCGIQEATFWLENLSFDPARKARKGHRIPIAKLIDEYNYWLPQSTVFKNLMSSSTA